MNPAERTRDAAPAPCEGTERLAGQLRTEVNRLAYHLRTPAASEGITPSRLAALYALRMRPDGARQGDLAALLGMSAASMTRLVEILLEAGWVSRVVDAEDQRARLVRLTPQGTRLVEGVRTEGTKQLREDLDSLTAQERSTVAAAVPILRALADRHLQPS